MYPTVFVILTLIAKSGYSLVFRLPTLNDNVYPGESNLMAWSDFGDVTEVNAYLAHGTPSNYTILQTLGENIPSSTNSMMYHLPTTLPPTDVFFILEGNDSPKSVATRSVYVDSTRGGFNTFPSTFPSISFPSNFPSISFPSNFPFGVTSPTSASTPDPIPPFHSDPGLPFPAIIGISMGSLFLVFVILTTVIVMRRRTMIKKRRALLHQLHNVPPTPPTKWSPKPTDINVNVSVQGAQENQTPQQDQSQHIEYNYNYQQEYNYNPQYQYEHQTEMTYTNQQQPSYISPGGFFIPSPKTAAPTTTPYSPAPTDSTKTSAPTFENKPNLVSPPPEAHHKPNENSFEVPHSSPITQKPHSPSSS